MARVTRFTDGYNHLMSGPCTTLDSLCGICQDHENMPQGPEFEGEVTCDACRETAWVVFDSCKKKEVK
jgi:hypothetical protein